MRIDILTLFPEMFEGVLGTSILGRAARDVPDPAAPDDLARARPAAVSYHLHQLRDYSADPKHQKVDSPPYGGGPGMVMQCQPVWDAVAAITHQDGGVCAQRILLTPTGRPLTQRLCERLAKLPRLLLIAGHYEGLDQRVLDRLADLPHRVGPGREPDFAASVSTQPADAPPVSGGDPDPEAGEAELPPLLEISVGDYVLSGGELPAMTLVDAVVRLLPGVLGHADSAREDSFSPGRARLLDHPHYTRPAVWEGRGVPEVLLQGNHAAIDAWRAEQSRSITARRRPDLLGLENGVTPGRATPPPTVLRDAGPADTEALLTLHREVFPGTPEASLVRDLIAGYDVLFSVVAQQNDHLLGHVLLTSMTHSDGGSVRGLAGLGPLAVHPDHRRRGIGAALVREAIRQAKENRVAAVLVLGDPDYYRRFGFAPAAEAGLSCRYPDAGDAFQVLRLRPPTAPPIPQGVVDYTPAFAEHFPPGG